MYVYIRAVYVCVSTCRLSHNALLMSGINPYVEGVTGVNKTGNRQKSLLSCSRHSGLGRPSLNNLNSKFKVKNLRRESWEGEWGLQGGGRRGIVILNPVVRKASVER